MPKAYSARAISHEMEALLKRDPKGLREVIRNGCGYIDGVFFTNGRPFTKAEPELQTKEKPA